MAVCLSGGEVKTGKSKKREKGPLDLIEEAVHTLRLMPLRITALYFIGSMPFVLGFLYFIADMSKNAFAHQRVSESVLLMVFLYLWMKCWQTLFCNHVRAYIAGSGAPGWSLREIIGLVLTQTAVQPLSFFILPAALLITLPFGYAYAFFQNFSLYGNGKTGSVKAVRMAAFSQARLFPMQNHLIILIIYIFGFFVFLNVMSAIILLPYLFRTFLGIESSFTLAGPGILNTTLLAASLGLCYLLVNPVVKTVFVLRCFYGEALHSGEDLKIALRQLRPSVMALIALFALLIFAPAIAPSAAAAPETAQIKETGPSAADLDRSLSRVINKKEYAWRLPREKPPKEEPGPVAAFIRGVVDTVGDWLRTAMEWIGDIIEWIMENLFGRIELSPGSRDRSWSDTTRLLLYALVTVALCILALYVARMIKNRGRSAETAGVEMPAGRDLESEDVTADDLPMDEWLELAREMSEKGDLRLALRALYLGSLASLASRGMVSIARYKSNRDYEHELRRRAAQQSDTLSAFSDNVSIFESAWYGMHEVSPETYRAFSDNNERIITLADRA